MDARALLMLCGLAPALFGAAAAEPVGAPPGGVVEELPPGRIVAIVRQSGFDPVGRPVRKGELYTLRALDPYDVEYRLVIDARTGRTVSLREMARPGAYEPVPAFARIFGRAEDGYPSPRPPRDIPRAPAAPPQKSAATATPLPRPRPYFLDATGSIPVGAPKPATAASEAQKAPEPQKAAEAPKDNGGATMPPVPPLE